MLQSKPLIRPDILHFCAAALASTLAAAAALPFGVHPFGLTAATRPTSHTRQSAALALGAALGYALCGAEGLPYLAGLLFALPLRYLLSTLLPRASLSAVSRASCAAGLMFTHLLTCALGGFSAFNLLTCLLSLALGLAATFLPEAADTTPRLAAHTAAFAVLLLPLANLQPLGLTLAVPPAALMLLLVGLRRGAAVGGMCGAILGTVLSLSGQATHRIAALAVGGIVIGLMKEKSRPLAATLFLLAVGLLSLYITRSSAALAIACEVAPACAALVLLPSHRLTPTPSTAPPEWDEPSLHTALCRACEGVCRGCLRSTACRIGRYADTERQFCQMAKILLRRPLIASDLEEDFKARCPRFGKLLQVANRCRSTPTTTLCVQVTVGQLPKEGESVCGDVVRQFSPAPHLQAVLVCDGMGSGQAAHEQATLTADLAERLISGGMELDKALRLLNGSLLLATGSRRFSTLDLLIIDRRSGRADLYKAGAADTLLLRNGRRTTLSSPSLPVGLLADARPIHRTLHLRAGDRLILHSDGVTPHGRLQETQAQKLCKTCLTRHADPSDDRTVAVVDIKNL